MKSKVFDPFKFLLHTPFVNLVFIDTVNFYLASNFQFQGWMRPYNIISLKDGVVYFKKYSLTCHLHGLKVSGSLIIEGFRSTAMGLIKTNHSSGIV